jgi:hypothetical protein
MKKILLLLLLAPAPLVAQYYRPPMTGTLLPSANFAETRPNHLHSGVDIKTGGAEGKPLYAAAGGYISRIGIAPRGFGRTIYINHPNGTTTVYAHMQRFTPAIERHVRAERYRQKKHAIDIYPAPDKFPVGQGELIGYSGNSGSSAGPHLHYELRDAATQHPLNPVREGIVDFKDDIAPTIVRLYYVTVDTVGIVPVCSAPRSVEVVRSVGNTYTLRDTAALAIPARCAYFVLEATDRKNDTGNTMGIYRVAATVDGQALFGFALDRFGFGDTKYVNSLCHYQLQRNSRNQMLRLALQAGNRLPVFTKMRDRGALVLDDDARHSVTIEVEDDAGNKSLLTFGVRRRAGGTTPTAPRGEPVDATRDHTASLDGAGVTIPAGALYDNVFLTTSRGPSTDLKGRRSYSDVYGVGDPAVPLHKAIAVSIAADSLPADLRAKACLGLVTADGAGLTYAGGRYNEGRVEGTSSVFGRFAITADTAPPTISLNFAEGADLRGRDRVTITLRDDFSGLGSYSATVDGEWMILEQQGATFTHVFDPEKIPYTNTRHTMQITATDNKGNTRTLTREFIR